MISSNTIAQLSKAEGIGWGIIEKDYFLTLLLDGIANNPFLRANFVFKGGTALRKVYFRHYRYSEDLDFTLRRVLTEKEIEDNMNAVFEYLKKEYNADFRIRDFYSRKWFTDIKVQFVGIRGGKNTITMDLTSDEVIVDKTVERKVFNPYYEKTFSLPVYSIDEILAEKLRSFLQRTRVRDYYDSWYILTRAWDKINIKKVKEIFIKKTEYRKIRFSGKAQLLDSDKIEQARAYYRGQIGGQVSDLPDFDRLIQDLHNAINELDFSGGG